jgi:hypothetical protein
VFMSCYFYVIACSESYVLSERSEKIVIFKKASDTHILLPIFTMALVFSTSMHDRWNYQLFTKVLRS